MTADVQARDRHARGSGDEARSISTRPATVGVVTEVKLGPCTGELTKASQGNAGSIADDTTLGVLIGDEVLGSASGDSELDSLIAVEEAVDATIGADLVVGNALLVLVGDIVDLGDVLVLLGNVALGEHHVAAIVARGTDIARVGDLGKSGTLNLALGAATERGDGVDALARATSALSLDGLLLEDSGSCGGSGSGSRSSRRSGSGSRGSGLLGHDKVIASLERSVGILVGVTRGGSGGDSGQEKGGSSSELHICGCRLLI